MVVIPTNAKGTAEVLVSKPILDLFQGEIVWRTQVLDITEVNQKITSDRTKLFVSAMDVADHNTLCAHKPI